MTYLWPTERQRLTCEGEIVGCTRMSKVPQ